MLEDPSRGQKSKPSSPGVLSEDLTSSPSTLEDPSWDQKLKPSTRDALSRDLTLELAMHECPLMDL
jgi:hypothetical protein